MSLFTKPGRRRQLDRLTTGGSTGHPLMSEQDSTSRDNVTAAIMRHLEDCLVFVDKGFIDQERAWRLKDRQGVLVLTPKRSNRLQRISMQSYLMNPIAH